MTTTPTPPRGTITATLTPKQVEDRDGSMREAVALGVTSEIMEEVVRTMLEQLVNARGWDLKVERVWTP